MKKMKLFYFFATLFFLQSLNLKAATVVDIVVGSADHDTLEAAVIAAELADDLSGEGPFTVFAPTDAAFKALPAGTLETLLADPTGDLADILLYHVVSGNVMSGDLSDGMIVETLLGKDIKVKIEGGKVYINDAMVTSANIEADNGVVHVIDAVLLPPVTTSLGDNLNENAEIAVFPNPASDYLNVTVNVVDAEDLKVSIINTSGTVFSDFVMNSSTSESLDISYLAPGMYYLTISGNNSFQSTKFIVTR
jgi:uncharacterized surface protein with fasciclin (FAS1) repeats